MLGENPITSRGAAHSVPASRVVGIDDFGEMLAVYMHIYLGGRDGFMPEHLLDGTDICPVLQEMGGKRMPEGVGADFFPDARQSCLLLDDGKDHGPGKTTTTPVQEQYIFKSLLGFVVDPYFIPIQLNVFTRYGTHGNKPFFPSLAAGLQESFLKIKITQPKVQQLGNPQPASV